MRHFMAAGCFVSLAIILNIGTSGCSVQSKSDSLRVAMNPKLHRSIRINAALDLKEEDREKLQSDLFKSLPGDWDTSTLDAIIILGEIGDKEASKRLQLLGQTPLEVSGKFLYQIDNAIEKIHKRFNIEE